ncbi:hypothetical protein [Paracoccus luteus]|uniref:hypothetical protein n=1 Tax=Paracoccus luteus TaxID=2508543 RepID=UPI0014307A89|nr:hypothetical protein [Paracoccus luteus]
MAFTDNCDVFASIHEDGMNRIARHIMRQRPSWFNFATPDVAANRELWCSNPRPTGDVTRFGNPIFTIMPYLPVIGADSPPVGLGFCAQITRAQIDFHPSSVFGLPDELGSKLDEQRLAIEFQVCGGIRCPERDYLDKIPVAPPPDPRKNEGRDRPPQVQVPGRMNCFCLDVFAVAHVEREFINGVERVVGKLDGIEIVDVAPEGLEANMECYIRTAVSLYLRQKLAIPLKTLFVDFPLFGMGTVSLAPTPNPPVPHNPAVEEDQLKAFVTMTVTP